jgi:hypothetical protein
MVELKELTPWWDHSSILLLKTVLQHGLKGSFTNGEESLVDAQKKF